MSNLEKINVLTKNKLDSLDLTQYPNQIFGTTDEVAEGGGSSITVDSELSLTSENPVQNKVVTNSINGLRGTVLWTNPSPKQTFASQTITLSSSDYDYLEIYFYASKSNTRTKTVGYEKGEYGFLMDYCASGSSVGPRTFVRNANVTNNTSVFFENGYEGYNSGEYLQNDGVIPIKIIGYKRS